MEKTVSNKMANKRNRNKALKSRRKEESEAGASELDYEAKMS
jgi:hypothetical protein